MVHSYVLLLHDIFKNQCYDFVGSFPESQQLKINKQITTSLLQIKSNPSSYKPLIEVRDKRLQGIIRRIYVGGNQRYRLMYLYFPNKSIIIPIFISEELRKNFDYDQAPWEEYADRIYNDLIDGNDAAFSKY